MQLFDPTEIQRMFMMLPSGNLVPVYSRNRLGKPRQRIDRCMSIHQTSRIFNIPVPELKRWWWSKLMATDNVPNSLVHFILIGDSYKPTISFGEIDGTITMLPADGVKRLTLQQATTMFKIGIPRLKRWWLAFYGWVLQSTNPKEFDPEYTSDKKMKERPDNGS